MSLRVLRIITRVSIGGPATNVTLADRGLRERGWQTLLVHGRVEPDELAYPIDAGTAAVHLPTLGRAIRPVDDARTVARVARIIRHYRPDVIHTHTSKAGALGRTAGVLVASATPRVHTFHGTVFDGYFGPQASRAIVATERALGRLTSRLLAISERQRDELLDLRIGDAGRIGIVPLGLDLSRFRAPDPTAVTAVRARLGIPADAVAIVSIGRLVPIKRIDRLIEAFGPVARAEPAARLYIVGDGRERGRLEAQAAGAGLASRVTFAGWTMDAPDWDIAADIVALTSDYEGTPLALIEAAAAGRPSVATAVGGVEDVVVDGVTGLVVPRDDVDALSRTLLRLVRAPALRAALGSNAVERAGRWSADRLVHDLDRLYRELIRPTGDRPPAPRTGSGT